MQTFGRFNPIMKKIIFLLFLSVCVFSPSCSPIIKLVYGIHQPRVLNKEKIDHFLVKNNLDTTNNVAIKDKDFLYIINKIKMTFPEIMVFDKEGKFIMYKEDKTCNASAFKFIDSLNNSKNYPRVDSIELSFFENKFVDLYGKGDVKIMDSNSDYFLLIFWTEWTGKLNKDHTYIWEQNAKKNKNASIKTVKVNCDFQTFWDNTEREKNIKALNH